MPSDCPGASASTTRTRPDPDRPNIVFILTDDQGPWAVPWEMPELQMPNLQQLADQGIVFQNYYCASPVCSPARASLLTGRMPSAHGIHDWLIGTRHPQAHPDQYLDDLLTLPQVLAGGGYTCGLSGKWHVGESCHPAPGFDYWYAHRFGGGTYYRAPIWDQGKEAEEPEYFTYAVRDHALEFLRQRNRSKPFYLQICTTAPHDPWDKDNHPDQLLDLYKDCDFPSVPRPDRHQWSQVRPDFDPAFENPQPFLQGYCASLTGVDQLIGQVRQELSAQGVAENTAIFYMADNGFSCGHHGIWGKGNGTYPLNFWENSVRVPFVAYLPPALRRTLATRLNSASDPDSASLPEAESHLPLKPATLPSEDECRALRTSAGPSGQDSTLPVEAGEEQVAALPGVVEQHLSACGFFPTICELVQVSPPVDPLRAAPSQFAYLLGDGEGVKPAGNRPDSVRPGSDDARQCSNRAHQRSATGRQDADAPDGNTDMLSAAELADQAVVVFDEYGGGRMIRSGRWKYVARFQGPSELYDLQTDPDEENNLAIELPDQPANSQLRAAKQTDSEFQTGQQTVRMVQQVLHQQLESWFAAHETAQHRAYDQPVRGYGQIHPNWRQRGQAAYQQGRK